MNKWKVSFFVCLCLLFLNVIVVLFVLLNQGTAYTYLEESYEDQVKANKILGNLIVKGGQEYSQKDFLYLLRQQYPDAFLVEETNKILMGPNTFEFKNNKLYKVH